MNFDKVPAKLRLYPQWICWRYEERQGDKPTKVPYDPKTGFPAAVDNPTTWTTFEFAVQAFIQSNGAYAGIGFVLTENDPFTFIDLDGTQDQATLDRQMRIFNAFDTYAERSPSGNGAHLIIEGVVPRGRRRGNVEIYSSLRYMTVTGDALNNKPIEERQNLAMILWDEMGRDQKGNTVVINGPQIESDEAIIHKASNAANGTKFSLLFEGRWQEVYPHIAAAGQGQSEADFALIDMLAFWTTNHEQIIRLFRASGLGKRPKALRIDYVSNMVLRAFDRQLPPQDFERLEIRCQDILAASKAAKQVAPANGAVDRQPGPGGALAAVSEPSPMNGYNLAEPSAPVNPYEFPPGLIGEIAEYIYAQAPRPVREVALAGAIGLMAGITGRTFMTPTGAALNLYTLLIAKSGRGKEGIGRGVSRLVTAAAMLQPNKPGGQVATPAIMEFMGPSKIRSDAALLKALSEHPCMVSIIGEFGLELQAMTASNANSHLVGLRTVLLDLYHKGDRGNRLGEMVYADKDKNTKAIYGPAFSLLCETTPGTYYEALSEQLIAQGLLPRFLTIEYPGQRPPGNYRDVEPSVELSSKLAGLAAHCLTQMNQGNKISVGFDELAFQMQHLYDKKVDELINAQESDAFAELWNRAHLKALKLASLVAVGVNYLNPLVTADIWQWAERIVDRDVLNVLNKFETGQIGKIPGDEKQVRDIIDAIIAYIEQPWNKIRTYSKVREGEAMHADRIIPGAYLGEIATHRSSFKDAKEGKSRALYTVLRNLVESGVLMKEKGNRLKDAQTGQPRFSSHGDVYWIADETQFIARFQGKNTGR